MGLCRVSVNFLFQWTDSRFDSLFVFDQYELEENQHYMREGENLNITIGVFEWNPEFYAEIKLEDNNGQFSETVSYTIN